MKLLTCLLALLSLAVCLNLRAETASSGLVPILAQPDKVILQNDFSSPEQLKKETWKPNQGTRWSIESGVLRGIPSSAEFQASKKDHHGFEPRVSVPVTPAEFVASFSFRFIDGSETAIVPFVEFGHHVARIQFSSTGTSLLAEHDSLKVAESKSFRYEPGKWYHALAELKGEEFVLQIQDGPTLYAQHESYGKPPTSGGNGFGVAGPKGGIVELDNVIISTIKASEQSSWPTRRSQFPKFEPVLVKAKPSNAKPSKE